MHHSTQYRFTAERPSLSTPGPRSQARRPWRALRAEFLIEAWALGMFMISAGVCTTLLESARSPLPQLVVDGDVRRMLNGIAMGLTAIALIYSPWGKRSGAHMNPAVTLAFWRLGKITSANAVGFILAQLAGGVLGVLVVEAAFGDAFTSAPVSYVVTLPGSSGVALAFIAEFAIAFLLMSVVLRVSNSKLSRFTGACAGALVAAYITFEAPLSGMSMNPARTFASALPSGMWGAFWIYVVAPVAAMQAAAAIHMRRGNRGCAKLIHAADQPCIHCGYEPALTPTLSRNRERGLEDKTPTSSGCEETTGGNATTAVGEGSGASQ